MTQFTDVAPDAWYAPYVEICVADGLMEGVGDGKFTPDGPVNEDEAIVMAARVLWHADGGEGPLPQGPTPEEMVRRMGDDAEYWFQYGADTAQWMSELWSWDGLCYLLSRVHEEDYDLPLYLTTYPATRSGFFHALAFAAQGLELPAINEIDQVPGARARDEDLLRLYRAGILTGTDAYGSFSGQQALTRAEAAAALARLLRPELRLSFRPESMDYPYTLTYLMDGVPDCGITYPVCVLGSAAETPHGQTGVLLLDGTLLPWPGSGTPSGSLAPCGDYVYFGVYDDTTENPYDTKAGLMDRNGQFIVPMENMRTHYTYAIDGGFFSEVHRPDDTTVWTLLNEEGQLIREVEVTGNDPTELYPPKGRSPFRGIEDRHSTTGEFKGSYYVDAAGSPVSEDFDWCGGLTADGQGFVGLNGKIYRIEFER